MQGDTLDYENEVTLSRVTAYKYIQKHTKNLIKFFKDKGR